MNPWEKEESCCAPAHRPELHINGQDSAELSHSVASLHNILLGEALTTVLSIGLFSIMLVCNSTLCVGDQYWPMVVAWLIYMFTLLINEGLIVWELVLIVIGFFALFDHRSKLMIFLACISAFLPMTQFFGLFMDRGKLDPLTLICNFTTPTEGFLEPRWIGTQFAPSGALLLTTALLIFLNRSLEVSYRPRIQLYD